MNFLNNSPLFYHNSFPLFPYFRIVLYPAMPSLCLHTNLKLPLPPSCLHPPHLFHSISILTSLHLRNCPLTANILPLPKPSENTQEVTLTKSANGLGFSFLMCELDPPTRDFGSLIQIKQLFPGQPAEQSGRIQEGDVLLAINGQSLKELSYPVCAHLSFIHMCSSCGDPCFIINLMDMWTWIHSGKCVLFISWWRISLVHDCKRVELIHPYTKISHI